MALKADPPELVDARWRTRSEDPTNLDLYPLWGRSAFSDIFVQVDLLDDEPILASQVEFWVESALIFQDVSIRTTHGRVVKGSGGAATIQATVRVFNHFNWAAYREGDRLTLKVRTEDSEGGRAVYEIG
jgi:hypothetical protein